MRSDLNQLSSNINELWDNLKMAQILGRLSLMLIRYVLREMIITTLSILFITIFKRSRSV